MAPVVIVAVCVALIARSLVGLKVAVLPMQLTAPGTGVAPCVKVNVVAVQVAGSIASLKVAAMFLLMATAVAALPGFVELTVGAVVSVLPPPPLSSSPHPAMKAASSNVINHIPGILMAQFP